MTDNMSDNPSDNMSNNLSDNLSDNISDQELEKHAEQLNRHPWEPAGVVNHQFKKDHNKKTQTSDKGGIENLVVEEIFHNKGMMDQQ